MKASMLFGPDYECKYEWDCFCQAGKSGLVLAGENSYTTAFFEAFPSNPNCFIRGEGGDGRGSGRAMLAEIPEDSDLQPRDGA